MSADPSTQRIEAFSDGVFSIAITLLVLELQLPAPHTTNALSLAGELRNLWPAYLGYVMSFIMIGIYWANHHYIFRLYRHTDHIFNLLNLFFLMCISFLPFPAAVLSQRFSHSSEAQTAVFFYAFGLFLPALGFTLMWFYGSANHRLIDKHLSHRFIRHLRVQYLSACIIYGIAMVLASYSYRIALGICVVLTLLFLFPSRSPEFDKATPASTDRAS